MPATEPRCEEQLFLDLQPQVQGYCRVVIVVSTCLFDLQSLFSCPILNLPYIFGTGLNPTYPHLTQTVNRANIGLSSTCLPDCRLQLALLEE